MDIMIISIIKQMNLSFCAALTCIFSDEIIFTKIWLQTYIFNFLIFNLFQEIIFRYWTSHYYLWYYSL